MKNHINWKYWAIILVLVIVPVAYFVSQFTDVQFIDSAMGNWFATMVGAIGGIFIALELERWKNKSDERDHTNKVLTLVKGELQENLSSLNTRVSENNPNRFNPYRLKDELWNAFSDGGELQWIKDLDLLDKISGSYYRIRIIINLEDKYFDAIHYQGGVFQSTREHILSYLNQIIPQATSHIKETVTQIDKRLQ